MLTCLIYIYKELHFPFTFFVKNWNCWSTGGQLVGSEFQTREFRFLSWELFCDFVKVAQSCPTVCHPIQSMKFSRPEYWSGEPFLFSRGSFKPRFPALQVVSLPAEPLLQGGKGVRLDSSHLCLHQEWSVLKAEKALRQQASWGPWKAQPVLQFLFSPSCKPAVVFFFFILMRNAFHLRTVKIQS